jgi:dihydroxyacetone kinase-like predicted kinase
MDDVSSRSRPAKLELAPVERGQIAVVVVSPGIGLSRIFASLGAAAIVSGGQTMNPSTQDLLSAFENLPTDKIIILPNNKNIVMAANQAREVTVKNLEVVCSRSVAQGLAAMLVHDPNADLAIEAEKMNHALTTVRTGEITVATRSTSIEGVAVEVGQTIGLLDGRLVNAAPSVQEAVLGLLKIARADEHELITMIYGEDLAAAQANLVADAVRQAYPRLEIELQDGGQPHYPFILSIE